MMASSARSNDHAASRRARNYHIQAAVLRRRNLGEADRILTVFSRELGKHRCVAKGVRRPGSKLAGQSEPYMISHFYLARTRGLPILTQAESVRAFPRLRTSEQAIAVAGLVAERIEVLTPEDEAAPHVYALIERCLELLDSGADPERVLLIFDLLLLSETGFRPGLQQCIECGQPLTAVPNLFAMDRGGFICERCPNPGAGARGITVDVQKIMRMIDRGDLSQVLGVRVRPEIFRQAEALISDYIATITGRNSTATRVIRDLRLEYEYQPPDTEPEESDDIPGEASGA
jgi:DNA repair protein RecO (recombination protein O)